VTSRFLKSCTLISLCCVNCVSPSSVSDYQMLGCSRYTYIVGDEDIISFSIRNTRLGEKLSLGCCSRIWCVTAINEVSQSSSRELPPEKRTRCEASNSHLPDRLHFDSETPRESPFHPRRYSSSQLPSSPTDRPNTSIIQFNCMKETH
jgi:hypothetical protein